MCTGALKNVVSRYINRGSSVLGCFLDASKAFDLVNHGMLFQGIAASYTHCLVVLSISLAFSKKACVVTNTR